MKSIWLIYYCKQTEVGAVKRKTENQAKYSIEKMAQESTEEAMEQSIQDFIEVERPKEELVEPVDKPWEESTQEPAQEEAEKSAQLTQELTEKSAKELTQEQVPDHAEEKIQRRKRIKKRIVICIASFFSILIVAYLGMAIYFSHHYYFGSEINCINVSWKTIEEAKTMITSEIDAYTLTLKERGGKTEQIKATEVGLKYDSEEVFNKFKASQDPLKWISPFLNKDSPEMTVGVTYDEKLLKERIDNLSCFDEDNIIEPENASIQYIGNGYIIVDEELGNKVDKDILYSTVVGAILNEEVELDLESADCYIEPQYNSESPEIIKANDTLNKYVNSKITYTFGSTEKTLDGSTINKWLEIGENFEVILDEDKVKEYVDELLKNYNTIGKTRYFVTSLGKTIKVRGGDYGWAINKDEEAESLISDIKEGKTIVKEPNYIQTAFYHGTNDIGNTYVEISLSRQHMWFYKNGSLITHGDIVTGNVKNGYSTPKGIYRLKYKAKDVVLKGDDYEASVTYWMPFNGGIGIHDANWRSQFGGDIYKTNGSHGCINTPYNVAKAIFNSIKVNTPVICY